jgi:hypothetical protein
MCETTIDHSTHRGAYTLDIIEVAKAASIAEVSVLGAYTDTALDWVERPIDFLDK